MKLVFEKRSVRNTMLVIALALIVTTGASLTYNLGQIHDYYTNLALTSARSFFQTVVVTRRWNAQHGGVYVAVTQTTRPNLYLDDPLRDITTTTGLKLTKINPAYMTRMISEVAKQDNSIRIHITSLNPLNPANKADAWEQAALQSFEHGKAEMFSLETGVGTPLFRYIAPLKTEQSCLACHAKQGYRVGDIRGGIGVSLLFEPYQQALSAHRSQMITLHLAFLIISLAVLGILGMKLAANTAKLEEALVHIRDLEGILPVCSNCKKIRTGSSDAEGGPQWVSLEEYVLEQSTMEFSHGICPECMQRLYPQYAGGNAKAGPGKRKK